MVMIAVRRPWQYKPDGPVELNWDDPLTEGLEHFYILNEGDGPPLDLVTGEYLTNSVGSPGWAVDEDGPYLDGDGASSYWGAIDVLPYPITIAGSAFKRNKVAGSTALGLGQNASVGGLFILNFRDSVDDESRTYCRSRSGQSIQSVPSIGAYNVNQNYTLAATSTNSTDLRYWVDGQYQGQNTTGHGTNPTWDRLALMGLTRNTAGADHDGGLRWAGVWSRDLRAEEHAVLHENINTIIQPRRIFISSAPLGASMLFSQTSPGDTSICSVSPLISVNHSQVSLGDLSSVALSPVISLDANQVGLGGQMSVDIDCLASIVCGQLNQGDTSSALFSGTVSAAISATQISQGDQTVSEIGVQVSVSASQTDSGDVTAAILSGTLSSALSAAQTSSGDQQNALIATIITVDTQQVGEGDSSAFNVSPLASIQSSQQQDGDVTVSSVTGILGTAISSAQLSPGDLQQVDLQSLLSIAANSTSPGDTQVVMIRSGNGDQSLGIIISSSGRWRMFGMYEKKSACAQEPFSIDWSDLYSRLGIDVATNPITSSVWTVESGTGGLESITSGVTTIILSGGAPGEVIKATNNIEINNGQYSDCATIYIRVF